MLDDKFLLNTDKLHCHPPPMRRIPTPADASEKQIASLMAEDGILPLAEEYNRRYLSWEEVYYRTPEPYDAGAVWKVVRHLRARTASVITIGCGRFTLNLTEGMLEDLRFIDGLGTGDRNHPSSPRPSHRVGRKARLLRRMSRRTCCSPAGNQGI